MSKVIAFIIGVLLWASLIELTSKEGQLGYFKRPEVYDYINDSLPDSSNYKRDYQWKFLVIPDKNHEVSYEWNKHSSYYREFTGMTSGKFDTLTERVIFTFYIRCKKLNNIIHFNQ